MNYTPGKLKIRENEPRNIAENNTEIIIEGSGAVIARMNDGWDNPTIRANAERIVKAVNCHDDLIEALKWALVDIEKTGYASVSSATRMQRALSKAEGR